MSRFVDYTISVFSKKECIHLSYPMVLEVCLVSLNESYDYLRYTKGCRFRREMCPLKILVEIYPTRLYGYLYLCFL